MTDHRTQHPRRDADDRRSTESQPSGGRAGRSASRKSGAGQRANASFWGEFGQVGGLWEEPVHWAIPIFRVPQRSPLLRGLMIRVHFFFVLLALVFIGRAIWPPAGHPIGGDWAFTLIGLGALLVAVCFHEAAHLAINRVLSGDADEVVLWPLGGLGSYEVHEGSKPDLLIALAGPLANLGLFLVLSPILALFVTHDWGTVIFNPLDPASAFSQWVVKGRPSNWALALWLLNYSCLVVFILNLLPMYPLDGGHIAHQLIRSRTTRERRAAEITTVIGYGSAIVLATLALFLGSNPLLAVAIFGALMSYLKRRQIAFLADPLGEDHGAGILPLQTHEATAEARSKSIIPLTERHESEKAIAPAHHESVRIGHEGAEEAELDRILEKIHRDGVESLSPAENAILERATKRRQAES